MFLRDDSKGVSAGRAGPPSQHSRVEVSNAQRTMSPYMVGLAGDRFPCCWSADYPL